MLGHSNKLVKHYHRNVAPLIGFNSASDNTINERIIIKLYTIQAESTLGLWFAWLKTLRTDSPLPGAFMEALLTAWGINTKPLREKLQARRLSMTLGHDLAQSAISHSTVAAPWMLSAVFSGLWTTTHTTNGSSKSYNIWKDLPWGFAC